MSITIYTVLLLHMNNASTYNYYFKHRRSVPQLPQLRPGHCRKDVDPVPVALSISIMTRPFMANVTQSES